MVYFTLQLDYIININECVLLLQAYYSCLRKIHFLFLEDDFRETSASNCLIMLTNFSVYLTVERILRTRETKASKFLILFLTKWLFD